MLLKCSGADRLKMGCSMHATSRTLVEASLSQKDPIALKRALFLRFYGEDFEPAARRRIMRALGKAAGGNRKRTKKRRRNFSD